MIDLQRDKKTVKMSNIGSFFEKKLLLRRKEALEMRLRKSIINCLSFKYYKYSIIIFSIQNQNGCTHCTHKEKNL